ncbi:hypothetical protein N7519_005022 [Penicillium mononematosum]|uniref:uncharacterized protein n=1 Tax=Penicillium mononematosum TaxID=268346 RepID=UPI002548001E|nr:uncharacterized protein N7519_005022 [Penicillium mononematosum]KAJ6183721.1 hypothetical protein N7519_005022 [Penicillium mononematosum]
MRFFIATLALVGSAVAFPQSYSILPVTPSSSATPVSSTPVSSTPVSSTPVSSTPPSSSTAVPECSVDSDGDNGNHYGWCKKAKHWGTYKNGKSGDADDLGPSEEN